MDEVKEVPTNIAMKLRDTDGGYIRNINTVLTFLQGEQSRANAELESIQMMRTRTIRELGAFLKQNYDVDFIDGTWLLDADELVLRKKG